MAGVYVRVAGNIADNVITMTRLVNNMMFANVEAYNTTLQHAADNSKELLKVGIDTAKTFEQISKNTIWAVIANSEIFLFGELKKAHDPRLFLFCVINYIFLTNYF